MEIIRYNENMIVVDYAHTPDAVKNIIDTFNKLKHNRIITIIGCGGDRDKSKRSAIGNITTSNSSYVIFTNDNPRTENEMSITGDIIQGVDTLNYEIILDREKAIRKGIQILLKNDILLVLGKGHEDYQIIGNNKKYFSDIDVILKSIKE
jgi:UDP-N-acetylmuramoyl-L-alanyl-D-glutamate--2,6-diaminopimelate ligase